MALKYCCLAAENLILAAYGQGLGTCWIGISKAWLNTAGAKAKLGIPSGFRPVTPSSAIRKGSTPAPTGEPRTRGTSA